MVDDARGADQEVQGKDFILTLTSPGNPRASDSGASTHHHSGAKSWKRDRGILKRPRPRHGREIRVHNTHLLDPLERVVFPAVIRVGFRPTSTAEAANNT